jgi:sulfite reductase alpha subunit-like flavoprotein
VTKFQRKSQTGCVINGLCTSYLASLTVGNPSRVFLRESLFKLPPSIRTPIILIGTGSGIAPLRALLQEREFQAKAQNFPLVEMTNVLCFGCQSKKVDFLYGEEFIEALDRHALTSLMVAPSREEGQEKVYVQHLMRRDENKRVLFDLFDSGAHVFVCGGTMMGSDVAESFAAIIAEEKSKRYLLSRL